MPGMENIFSTSTATATQARLSMDMPLGRRNAHNVPTCHGDPLFLHDVKAEPATWSQEGVVVTLQRLFGWLPDSEAEQYKQEQSHPYFIARKPSHSEDNGGHDDVEYTDNQKPVESPCNLEHQRLMEEKELTAADFRKLLIQGFSAHKVLISGVLKNIHLKLVIKDKDQECYLTWTPSRKRHPRIHLHDVQEVVPILAQNNAYAPKLARKLSQLRGLIIISKSHHRGRMLLQVDSKAERDLLLRGFKLLLEEINVAEPLLDHDGAPRKRVPRRQSVLDFFDLDDSRLSSNTEHKDTSEDDRPATPADPAPTTLVLERREDDKPEVASLVPYYKTRFDGKPEERSSSKSSLLQPASTEAM